MEQAAFIRAILDEPEDTTLRLVFADWLEEHGQAARALWIRASCQLAGVGAGDPTFGERFVHERECFRQCSPEWWQTITGVTQQSDRGMFRFRVGSKTAATRLRKISWLGQAAAEGWLESIAIPWCDGSLARVQAKWPETARQIPLHVCVAPQITDEGLAFYLKVPQLWSLELPGHAIRNPSVRLLGERSDLRELVLDGMPVDAEVSAFFEQVGRLTGLRRLTIQGYERPTDADLELIGGLSILRELHLSRCLALTDDSLARLIRLTGLRLLKLQQCTNITDAGVAALQQALALLRCER